MSRSESESRYTWFLLWPMSREISLATSSRRRSMYAVFCINDSPIYLAAWASPLALMMVDLRCSFACNTTNLALSAFCCAICFYSIASVNCFPNVNAVMETSSRWMWNSRSLSIIPYLIFCDTVSRCTSSVAALYCATTERRTSFTTDGRTTS